MALKLLGLFLISLPFIFIFIIVANNQGIKAALIGFGIAVPLGVGICFSVIYGLYLFNLG